MATNEYKSDVVETLKKRRWFNFKPRLNYKPSALSSMPPTIDPRNWSEITPKELDLHQRRQEIRGRLRREFWTKAYHPQNYKHFNPVTTDPAYSHFARAKSVYHIKETMQMSKRTFFILVGAVSIPTLYFWACLKYDPYRSRWDSAVKS